MLYSRLNLNTDVLIYISFTGNFQKWCYNCTEPCKSSAEVCGAATPESQEMQTPNSWLQVLMSLFRFHLSCTVNYIYYSTYPKSPTDTMYTKSWITLYTEPTGAVRYSLGHLRECTNKHLENNKTQKGWKENLIQVPMLSWWLHSHYVLQTHLEESYVFTPPQPNYARRNKNPASLS